MKFYKIQLNTIHLTDDGTSTGIRAKLAVRGADELLIPYTGSVVQSVDGTPVAQIFQTGTKGKTLEISVETHLYKPVWEQIVAVISVALANSVTVNVTGIGDTGDFDVQAIPLLPRPFEAAGFENGRILKPVFRFITV